MHSATGVVVVPSVLAQLGRVVPERLPARAAGATDIFQLRLRRQAISRAFACRWGAARLRLLERLLETGRPSNRLTHSSRDPPPPSSCGWPESRLQRNRQTAIKQGEAAAGQRHRGVEGQTRRGTKHAKAESGKPKAESRERRPAGSASAFLLPCSPVLLLACSDPSLPLPGKTRFWRPKTNHGKATQPARCKQVVTRNTAQQIGRTTCHKMRLRWGVNSTRLPASPGQLLASTTICDRMGVLRTNDWSPP